MKRTFLCIFALICVLLCSSADAQLLKNPGFELGTYHTPWQEGDVPSKVGGDVPGAKVRPLMGKNKKGGIAARGVAGNDRRLGCRVAGCSCGEFVAPVTSIRITKR